MSKVESLMFKDRKVVIIAEYIAGFSLLILVLPYIVAWKGNWDSANWWAYLLFIVCAGIILVGNASGMKQRHDLSKHIKKVEQKVDALYEQAQCECEQKNKTCQQPFASAN